MARVLVVEDDADLRDSLAVLLRLEGYEVGTAGNGQEGLQELRAGSLPCVILLDLMMPIMDGVEMRGRLRDDPMVAQVPILILSGSADAASMVRTLDVVGYLVKPVDFPALLRKVREICGGGRARP